MRVLILHASAGAGHKRAAEALAKGFQQESPASEVEVRDILDFTPAIFRKTYAQGYLRLVRRVPELWGYMYAMSDRQSEIPWRRKVRATFNKINALSFFEFLDEYEPDVVVCTHFLPLELLSSRARRRRHRSVPFFAVVTDYAVHSLWILERVHGYYVSNEEARRHLIRHGQPADRVQVSGIPIDPVFGHCEEPQSVRQRLGLEAKRPAVLVLSGGFGVGPAVSLIRALKEDPPFCQLLVVAGANEELRREAEAVAAGAPIPIRIFGFVSNIHELMDASDLVVSKPGGLTSAELMAKAKPMLIVDPIPGQEQRNCEYLLEAGAAIRLAEIEDAPHRIRALLSDADRLHAMQTAARRIGRPHAAREIARDIANHAGK